MSKDFTIHQDGDRQIIERLSYPRFKGVVTFNSPLSDIEELWARLKNDTTYNDNF